jgi:hypothetical protein
MQETFQNPETPQSKPKASPVTIGMAVVVVAAILISLWFLFAPLQRRKGTVLKETVNLSPGMSAAELAYANKIEIGNIAMSRAENFLHQEVTTLTGELYNGGSEPVAGISLTTEFSDEMKQIVLRETRKVLGAPDAALAPGARRAFEISFEHVPHSWNMQAPTVRVSSLQLPARKQ